MGLGEGGGGCKAFMLLECSLYVSVWTNMSSAQHAQHLQLGNNRQIILLFLFPYSLVISLSLLICLSPPVITFPSTTPA